MRIGSIFHRLFHHQNANFVGNGINNPAPFPIRIEATARPGQMRELGSALAAIRKLPGGEVLMDALRVHAEITHTCPHIVLTQDRELPDVEHVDNETWRVNPEALRAHPERGLQALARLYEDMSQVRHGPFYGITRGQLPQPDMELQQKWYTWMRQDSDGEMRYDAIEASWDWFVETLYYGGIDHGLMIRMLDHIAANEPVPMPLHAELNLSGLSLKSLPDMPPKVYALRADDNSLETLEQLPGDLRILRLNRALNHRGGQALSDRLLALPDTLVELELDGNNLAALLQAPEIERWALPKNLELLSIRHNALSTLPAVQNKLTTLLASDNALLNFHPLALAKATQLREADFRRNAMVSVPDGIRLLSRSCRVDISENPLTETIYDLSVREDLSFNAARLCLADELRRVWGPTMVYSPERQEPAPAPNVGETGLPSTAGSAQRENEAWIRARRPAATYNTGRRGPAPAPVEAELSTTATPKQLQGEVAHWVGAKRMKAAAQSWRNIAGKDGAGYFMRMLQALRLHSTNMEEQGFGESVAEYLTEFIRPERAELREMTLAACDDRRARCVDHATLAFVQMKMLLANDDVRQGAYDHRPKELVELGEQLFIMGLLTAEALAKGKALFKDKDAHKQEYVEAVLRCYVHFKEKLNLSLVVPKMNFASLSGLRRPDLDAIEASIEKKRKEFPYFLMEWDGWHDMLKRNFPQGYASAQNQRFDDLDQLDLNITQALQRKELDSSDEGLRIREGVFVNRKMNYEHMARATRAYLESIGMKALALHAAPELAPATDEQILIGPI